MGRHKRDHDHRQSTRCAGNHARATADAGRHQPDDKGGIQANQRMHARHKGKGDGFGHQGQGHGQAGKQLVLIRPGVKLVTSGARE